MQNYPPFYRQRNQGQERLSNLDAATQLEVKCQSRPSWEPRVGSDSGHCLEIVSASFAGCSPGLERGLWE